MTRIAVSLGSNVNPQTNLPKAAALLRREWPTVRFSSVYRSAPIGAPNQDDFVNAVAVFEADESIEQVFGRLQRIEELLKKDPPFRRGPRTIDLDLLLADDIARSDPSLTIPHPRMHERRFVLEPLCELIGPETTHPTLQNSWASLLAATEGQRVEKTDWTL